MNGVLTNYVQQPAYPTGSLPNEWSPSKLCPTGNLPNEWVLTNYVQQPDCRLRKPALLSPDI